MAQPRISVIIPALNEEKSIGACLDSLVAQRTDYRFEVIIVDNESTDRTVDVVKKFHHLLDIHIVHIHERRRGNARFVGCKEASGSVFFCTDADVILPPNWIEKGMQYVQGSDVVALTGPCRIRDCPPHVNLLYNIWSVVWSYICRICMGTYLFRGNNIAVTREAYFAAGQFDPSADAHEDTDLAMRVSGIGKIIFRPAWYITTSGRRFHKGLLRGGLQYLHSFIRKFIFRERYIRFSNVR